MSVNETSAVSLPATARISLAVVSLLAANLGLLIIYFVFDLTLIQLLIVFWWESLWIGLFCALKLLTASIAGSPYENRWFGMSPGTNLFVSIVALGFVSAEFLGLFIILGVVIGAAGGHLAGNPEHNILFDQLGMLISVSGVFLISHSISFVVNFLLLREYRHARAGTLLALPFRRCLALMFTVGAALIIALSVPTLANTGGFITVLVLIKLTADYFLHRRERAVFANALG